MLEELIQSLSRIEDGKHSNSAIQSILKKKLGPNSLAPVSREAKVYWSAASFNLDRVSCFNSLTSTEQEKVLIACSLMRLEEAYYIEYAGMSYAAKMSLLADSIEEQRLYSVFAAEEARHFGYITQFFSPSSKTQAKPFVKFLNDTIARGSRMPLIFIIQVLLEGWGLDHYQQMTSHCTDTTLVGYLSEIVADEASHHGSGVILFDESCLSDDELGFVIQVMTQFLSDVREGPTGLMNCLRQEVGELKINSEVKEQVLKELDAFNDTTRKLELLKKMMLKVNAKKIVSSLDESKLFSADLA